VDEVVFFEEADRAKAIDMIAAGEMDVYAIGISDSELFRRIEASEGMDYHESYGLYLELTFNPVGPTFPATGKLNPFHVPAIREAVNWLVDRNFIVEELFGGLAAPRFTTFNTVFPDYARLADVVRALEIQYAPNPERAREVITREMENLGAELVDGTWHYDGKPVELIFLIRVEDERREIGDYVATLLEDLGFVVDRQYKSAAEASPIWIGGNPADGLWHLYTGGWLSTAISRDLAGNFDFFYTPRGRPDPLWQAYAPSPEFDAVADRLGRRDYTTPEERRELMTEALRRSMQDAVRVWLVDQRSVWPRRADLALAADLSGGYSGSWLWPFTLHFVDRVGGTVQFGTPSILTEPWNPIAGSNWLYDTMIMRGAADSDTLPDPFTGLSWPQRIKTAELTVEEGLPVNQTHDWFTLDFAKAIAVPEDAWIDWDVAEQRFITVGEAHPEGLTARTKAVIYYDDNLYAMQWHDGTHMALADFVLGMILAFDRAREASPLFDEAYLPAFESFQDHFRGWRIVRTDPLVIESYSDQIFPDAETIVATRALYPSGAWHNLALGILAEQNRELAFSSDKADKLGVEWMSYIAGPSLPILEKYVAEARAEGFIPYAKTLGEYVSAEEARASYAALDQWYAEKGHFWVDNGPFYLHSVHPVEGIAVIRRFEAFPDPADKWLRFSEPRLAEVAVSGPLRVTIGDEVEFLVEVTFQDKPYPMDEVEFVRFLLFDARGELALVNEAEVVEDGLWRVGLTAEQTKDLEVGSNRLEVIVVSRVVAIPTFESTTFVTVTP
jgi:peptide/nickel transport system substrate-binding protein